MCLWRSPPRDKVSHFYTSEKKTHRSKGTCLILHKVSQKNLDWNSGILSQIKKLRLIEVELLSSKLLSYQKAAPGFLFNEIPKPILFLNYNQIDNYSIVQENIILLIKKRWRLQCSFQTIDRLQKKGSILVIKV